MKTRCKFKVIGVENTEYAIFGKKYKDQVDSAEFEAIVGVEYTDYTGALSGARVYKSVPTDKFAQNIRLAAQYDSSNPEDVSFAAATPSGEMKFYCDNPVVVGTFVPGKNYYLDLIPCE